MQKKPLQYLIFCILTVFMLANQNVTQVAVAAVTGQDKAASSQQSLRSGVLVKIPLPLDSQSATRIRKTLNQIVEQAPATVNRQVIVLEFDTAGGKTGRGSELEACLSLARFLCGTDLNRVKTVAYIPPNRRQADLNETGSQLQGHAVLVALAANQIAMGSGTAIGNAGIDEDHIEQLVRDMYKGIASQRLTMPVQIAMAMLDKDLQLYRVRTAAGIVYANADELRELEGNGQALETQTVSNPGQYCLLTDQQLADYRLLGHRADSRQALANELKLIPHSLDRNATLDDPWRAVQVNLPAHIDAHTTQWVERAISYQINSGSNRPNMVIFNLEGNTGDIDACLTLARYLSEFETDKVQTVAFIQQSVRGPVGLVALACHQIIMAPETRLGGHLIDDPSERIAPEDLADLRPMIVALARDQQQDWSLMMSMLDPELTVQRYRNKQDNQLRLLSAEELAEIESPDDWLLLGPIDTEQGIAASQAEQVGVARMIADDMEQLKLFYQLDSIPTPLQPSATDRAVEKVALFLSSPFIATWLLFAGMFFLSSELSAPGLGVPGFLSATCFLLFFWSQYLGGNAHWLEIMLFLVGIVFIGMEIFVIPGFGVFGIGGILMVIISLILASQSFLFPSTSEELARLPNSLLPVVGAGMGVLVGAFVLRKVLPNSPYFNRMMLKPRRSDLDTGLETDRDRESMIDLKFLSGQKGESITKLVPAGKARIAGKVYNVITDGRMIEKGQPLVVTEAIGNRVVVKQVEE